MKKLSNDILYSALNQLSVGIIILDESQNIIFFNQWLSDYSGFKLADQEGCYLGDVFPQYQNSRLKNACESALSLGLPTRLSHTFNPTPLPLYQKNFLGNEQYIIQQQISIKSIPTNQSTKLCQIVIDNVTPMVKKEKTLKKLADDNKKQQRKAEVANLAKSQFLANMSHEIRTPINGVMGMLTLLSDTELNQTQQHFSKLAKVSAETLLHLINDILDFSKIEAGKLDIENIAFNLPDCIFGAVHPMAVIAQQKNLEVIVDTSLIVNEFIMGDPSRLSQIITNLFSNAIKFTEQGEITITVSFRDVIADSEQNTSPKQLVLCVVIEDTGIGIPKEKCADLFSAFTQVDASTTREFGGTGLGLTIVKQLCQLMGGDISVESKQGQGSKFTFYLGVEEASKVTKPLEKLNEKPVLLIDSHFSSAKLLSHKIQSWGLSVELAAVKSDLISVCEKITRNYYSVILLDDKMANTLYHLLIHYLNGLECETPAAYKMNVKNQISTPLIRLTPMNTGSSNPSELLSLFVSQATTQQLTKPIITKKLHQLLINTFEIDTQSLTGSQANINTLKSVIPAKEQSHIHSAKNTPSNVQDKFADKINQNKQARILLVEDNRINQQVALGLLRKIGYTADIAINGVEALALLKARQVVEPYSLILMDCQMPEMDGYSATSAIRTDNIYALSSKVNIIAMTANTMKGDEEKCLAVGMNDYLAKPINPTLLAKKIKRWLV